MPASLSYIYLFKYQNQIAIEHYKIYICNSLEGQYWKPRTRKQQKIDGLFGVHIIYST